ncbi:hypothetical protein MHU86_8062 [Fragilaria crotonensis]|nr:hypothetical protein MHU86_8062 [Fragilaria crotonensis]
MVNNGVLDDVHRPDASDCNEECDTAGAGQSRKNSRRETTVDKPIDDHNNEGFDDDFGMMSDGDVSVCNSSEESEDESEDNEIPDGIILDLYEEMQELRLNPFGLDRFSGEEKVHIELLHLLKELKAPLKAFSGILNWAAKANGQGHIFHPDCQPSRRKVVHNLYCRYNMKGLIPKEKLFYLPYSRRTVPMIYFDAREVFASLLSCPLLNRDENYLFDSPEKDPFIGPPKSSMIGDINTGQCYRKTYEALVKNPDVDMILPTIVAMDKTQVDTYGRLQMEPLTISHGLLKHSVRSKHTAMRILGYVCHSSPAHQTKMQGGVPDTVTPRPYLPDGSVIARVPLKPLPGLPWATYLLNEMHLQIEFILEVSGYLDLQRHGFKWNLHYNERVYPVVLHPYIPFIIGDTEGHDRLCGHYTARFEKVKQLCRVCECPTRLSGYSKAKFNHRKPAAINRLIAGANSAVSQVGATANLNALKDMSQNYLRNGFGRARFGSHNERGIFGACPGEMLHLVSLGWFKYCLEAFASQAGAKFCGSETL